MPESHDALSEPALSVVKGISISPKVIRRMRINRFQLPLAIVVMMASATSAAADDKDTSATIDTDGETHIPATIVPYSTLASHESKKAFFEFTSGFRRLEAASKECKDIACTRKVLDDVLMKPGVHRPRAVFPVSVTPEMMGGVQTDVVEPEGGVAASNKRRVLINLHGGGMQVGGRYGGQQESIPIASLGRMKVVTVDYRMAPEYKYPARIGKTTGTFSLPRDFG